MLAVWIVCSAIHRLVDPHDVRGGLVRVVALAGALVSLVASAVLAHASRESLNVRGAFLHVATERFGLTHTTLQVEHAEGATAPVELGEAVARRGPLRPR